MKISSVLSCSSSQDRVINEQDIVNIINIVNDNNKISLTVDLVVELYIGKPLLHGRN